MRTNSSLRSGIAVVVANTFSRLWEMSQYVELANELRVPLRLIEMASLFDNTHGVPAERVQLMKGRWERVVLSLEQGKYQITLEL